MTRNYQLKITLEDVKPAIWRRVIVPVDLSLAALHDVVQIAMGWTNSHLHRFEIGDLQFGRPDHMDGFDDMLDERRHVLGQLVGPRQRFAYEYDFGDGWQHQIVVEKELAAADGSPSVRCIEGARACPPEDCGGAYGYIDLLEAITDPKHQQHRELLDWIGGSFDPEAFDLKAINAKLGKMALRRTPASRKPTPRKRTARSRSARA